MMQGASTQRTTKVKIDTRLKISIRCIVFAVAVFACYAAIFYALENHLVTSIQVLSAETIDNIAFNNNTLYKNQRATVLKLNMDIDSKRNHIIWLQFFTLIGAAATLAVAMFFILKPMLIIPAKLADQIAPMAPKRAESTHWLKIMNQNKTDTSPDGWVFRFLATLEALVERIGADGQGMKVAAETLADRVNKTTADVRQLLNKKNDGKIPSTPLDTRAESLISDMGALSASLTALAAAAQKTTTAFKLLEQNSHRTRKITADALSRIRRVAVNADSFSHRVEKIDSAMDQIAVLSQQIDLLALNANIEAGKAGEAGKVFLRLTREIKAMARKTVEAAEGITADMGEIRMTTSDAVSEIGLILNMVTKADQGTVWIATEIDAQSKLIRQMAADSNQAVIQAGDIAIAMALQKEEVIQIMKDQHDTKQFLSELLESGPLMAQCAVQINALSAELFTVASAFTR